MSLPIIMHVNYCEQGQSLEEMCEKAVGWGYDGIEFRRARSGVDETPEQYLDAVAAAVEKSGLKQPMFGGPGVDMANEDAAFRAQEVKDGLEFYRLAAERFELTVCNTSPGPLRSKDPDAPSWAYDKSGSGAAEDKHFEWAAEGFRELGALAEELGFKLAFETHMGCLADLPEPTARLLDMIGSPAVGANLDYGNMVYFPQPPSLAAAVSTLAGRTYMLHLKNVYPVATAERTINIPCGLGDGIINHREEFKLLQEAGFDGPVCVEAPRGGDREWFAQQDIAYVQSVLGDLDRGDA